MRTLFLLCALLHVPECFAEDVTETFNLANGVFMVKDYDTALGYYREVLEKSPDFKSADEALFRKAECLYQLRKYAEAATEFEQVLSKYPDFKDSSNARYRLGEIYLTHLKKYENAARFYGELADKDPKHKLADSAVYFQGESLFKAENYARAVPIYQRLLKDFPDSSYVAATHYSLGWAFFLKGDFGSCVPHFDTIITKHPKEATVAESQFKKAEALFNLKKFPEAHEAYAAVIERGEGDFVDEAWIGRGRCLFSQGKKKGAAEVFTGAADKFPGQETAKVALFNAGSSLFAVASYQEALSVFDRLLGLKPDAALTDSGKYWRGRCLLKLERHEEAGLEFKGLLGKETGVDKAATFYSMGDAHFAAKKFAEAASSYGSVARDFPKHELADDALYSLCLCLEKLGQTDDGLTNAGKFLQAYPESPHLNPVRFLIGEFHYRKGDYGKAIPRYQEVFEAGGDLADDALYKLGWSQRLAQQPEEAKVSFARLAAELESSPFAAEAKFLTGKIADEKDDPETALALLDAAAKEFPGTEYGIRAAFEAALVHYQRNQFEKALVRLEKFLVDHPKSDLVPHAILHLSESYFETDKTEPAKKGYLRLLSDFPESAVAPAARYGYGWCLRKEAKLPDAAKEFDKVVADFPEDALAPEALYWSALSLEESGRFDEARQRFVRSAADFADSPFAEESLYRIGACLFGLKEYAKARQQLADFIAKHPASDWAPRAWYDLAWCHRELKEADPMKAAYLKIVTDFAESDLLGEALFALGELDYEAKAYAEAEAKYLKAVATKKETILDRAFYKLAWSYLNQEKLPEAVKIFRSLLAETPKSEFVAEAHYRIGRVLQKEGAHEQAVESFKKSLGSPSPGELKEAATFRIAEAYRELKEWGHALKSYQTVIGEFPKSKSINEALYGAGLCSMELGAIQDAVEAFEKVLKQTETVTAARAEIGLGEILLRQEKNEDAAKRFLKVYFIYGYPEWKSIALYKASQCFAKAGKQEQQKRYLDLLLKEFPDSASAKKAKADLGK